MVWIYWLYRWGDRKVYGRPGVARRIQMTDTENRGGPRNNWSAAILRVFTRLESLMGIMPRQAVSETGSADSLGSLSTETITGVDASVAVGGHYPANDGPDVAEIEAQEVINENLFLDDFLQYENSPSGPDDYDAPEPLAEYDGKLADPLYKPEFDDGNLIRNLGVDEIIASAKDVTDEQCDRIAKALHEYSPRKLSNLLRWLKGKTWTGRALLLFLEFRILWNEHPHWKEGYFWSEQLRDWRLSPRPAVLRRNDCYLLVNARLHCSPDEVIDEEWFEDWDRFALWEYGFLSFASFALFRAQHEDGDWQNSLKSNPKIAPGYSQENGFLDTYDLVEVNTHASLMLPGNDVYRMHQDYFQSLPQFNRMWLWYMVQDWHNPAEWHDNLD